jgi:hypothetical protein
MFFTIIETFSPQDGERWTSYCAWRGVQFERFDSIDGILRPNLFTPRSEEEWRHVVGEDFKIHFIIDRPFAEAAHRAIGRGEVVGVGFEDHREDDPSFLGYDILDGFCDVSLLTNWGNDRAFLTQALGPNALVPSFEVAQCLKERILKEFSHDQHVEGCHVVSVYGS